jgi:hypothetical protein
VANDQLVEAYAPFLFLLFFAAMFLLWLAATAFWVWMLIDCIKNEGDAGNQRVIWALLMVFLGSIVSILYCFIRRPQRIAEFGR